MRWNKKEIVAFLSHSYSKFEYRNIGIIIQLAYELRQQYKEIFLLKWCDVDLTWDNNILILLDKQKEDFGFQEYVAPQIRPHKGKYIPYSKYRFSKVCRKIINECTGIRSTLKVRYLLYS